MSLSLSVSLFVYSSDSGWGIEKAEGASLAREGRERRPWDFFGDCAIFVSRILITALLPPICRESAAQHRCFDEIAQGGLAMNVFTEATPTHVWSHCMKIDVMRFLMNEFSNLVAVLR